jgi:hypothetical protein
MLKNPAMEDGFLGLDVTTASLSSRRRLRPKMTNNITKQALEDRKTKPGADSD